MRAVKVLVLKIYTFFQLLLAGSREKGFLEVLKHAQKIGASHSDVVDVSSGDVGPSSEVIIQQTMEDILKTTQAKILAEVSFWPGHNHKQACDLENEGI